MVKVIHYFWFGGSQLPPKTIKCIESWKKFFPDFEIKCWNEKNFDVSANLYTRQAYEAKKWAFVSDYARFKVLEAYGGLYFDTDVEVIRNMDDLLELEAFAGFETDSFIAPGLVLWAREPGNPVMKAMREKYDSISFLDEHGERIKKNVCGLFTELLVPYGFVPNGEKQVCNGMTLFPKDYFCPFDDATGLLNKTENTYTIHWYDKSWMPKRKIIRNKCTRILHRVFGTQRVHKFRELLEGKNR